MLRRFDFRSSLEFLPHICMEANLCKVLPPREMVGIDSGLVKVVECEIWFDMGAICNGDDAFEKTFLQAASQSFPHNLIKAPNTVARYFYS